jgi:heterodisulfide reductase subunit A
MMTEEQKDQFSSPLPTGVIICNCGGKISRILDTDTLSKFTGQIPGVTYVSHEAFPCSKDGLERMQNAIHEHGLERMVIAGCTPRLMEKLFRRNAEKANLSAQYVEITDIREQCAYVHAHDPAAALEKAANLVAMGITRLQEISNSEPKTSSILRQAAVLGSDLGGLTVALHLASNNIPVTIIETHKQLGSDIQYLQERGRELMREKIRGVQKHPAIKIILGAKIEKITGEPGNYVINLDHGGKQQELSTGAILIAQDAVPQPLYRDHWIDRTRIISQVEFGIMLDQAHQKQSLDLKDIILILCPQDAPETPCSQVCCAAGIRQALLAKEIQPEANITVLFRDLVLDESDGKSLLTKVRSAGVTFFRYSKTHPPRIADQQVLLEDELTGSAVQLPFDCLVQTTPILPGSDNESIASLLNLPRDDQGYLIEPRLRLRPGRYINDGIFVTGGSHQPQDTTRVLFDAFMAATRIRRFLFQNSLQVNMPVAQVDEKLCTGCGNCVPACPTHAIFMQERKSVLSLSIIDPVRCIGCGNCVVVCPVKAITLPGWDDSSILNQISTALKTTTDQPTADRILVLACEWSAYAAADVAGARHLQYPSDIRILRMNCSARFDPFHVLWAFVNGADGVFLGVCPIGDCHYGSGNLYARERVEVLKKLMVDAGINPNRLRLEFLPGDDGEKFAKIIREFKSSLDAIKPEPMQVTQNIG